KIWHYCRFVCCRRPVIGEGGSCTHRRGDAATQEAPWPIIAPYVDIPETERWNTTLPLGAHCALWRNTTRALTTPLPGPCTVTVSTGVSNNGARSRIPSCASWNGSSGL